LEKEGYIRKFAVKDKKGNKLNRVILFGRNPNDPIELMNLSEEFKEFKDVKPVIYFNIFANSSLIIGKNIHKRDQT